MATLPVAAPIQSAPITNDRSADSSLKIIPWVEANFAKYDALVLEGLLTWRRVTDMAIVSTMPGRASLFRELREQVPELQIIPGLKTMKLLTRFDSVHGWKSVAREVANLRTAAGQHIILLENEVAMKSYVDGEYELNLDNLRKGLAALPADLQYLWYPSIWGNEIKRHRNAVVCSIVQEVLRNVRFLDQRYQGQNAVKARARIVADEMLRRIIKKPTLPMLYFYGPEYRVAFWRDDQLQEALGYIRREWSDEAEVVLYPGLKRWVDASRSLSKELPSRSTSRKRSPE